MDKDVEEFHNLLSEYGINESKNDANDNNDSNDSTSLSII